MTIVSLAPIRDTYIAEHYPDSSFGTATVLYVGQFGNGNDRYRSLVQFDLSSIPPDSTIVAAYLKLYIYRNDTPNISKPIKIFKALSGFTESTTYNSKPMISDTPETEITITHENNVYLEWNITDLVKGWCTGTVINNGLEIVGLETQYSLVGFRSNRFIDSGKWPLLEVDYIKGITTVYPVEYVTTTDEITGSTPLFLGPRTATFAVENVGSTNNALVLPQLSPDGVLWINNIPPYVNVPVFAPGDQLIINTDGHMPYTRIGYKSQEAGKPANLAIYPALTEL